MQTRASSSSNGMYDELVVIQKSVKKFSKKLKALKAELREVETKVESENKKLLHVRGMNAQEMNMALDSIGAQSVELEQVEENLVHAHLARYRLVQ